MAESERKVTREKFKSGYLETKAGTRLRVFGFHPSVAGLVMVQTEDGWKTTVDVESLLENEALLQLKDGTVPVTP